jgi:hypothetical protein
MTNQTTTKLSHHVRCIARATPYFDSKSCVADGEEMQIQAHNADSQALLTSPTVTQPQSQGTSNIPQGESG